MAKKLHLIHVKSNVQDKAPSASTLNYGEIAVNYNSASPAIYIKDTNDDIVKFIDEDAIYTVFDDAITGLTVNGSAATISDKVASMDLLVLPDVTISDENKILKVINGEWEVATAVTIYEGEIGVPPENLGNNGDIYIQTEPAEFIKKPVTLWETDGTTGLLGHNQNTYEGNWQLENLDLTPYKYIKCFFKATTLTDASSYTPAIVVDVPLDNAAKGATIFSGGQMVPLPFNRNRQYLVSCAVDATKTKFQVIHQNTIWDVTTSDANNNGRYCYKIVGYYD